MALDLKHCLETRMMNNEQLFTHAFSTNHVFLREKIVTAQGPHYCWAEVGLLATYMVLMDTTVGGALLSLGGG